MIESAKPSGETAARPPRQAMLSVEMLRGFAALAVVLFHTYIILKLAQYGSIDVFGWLASRGWLGVNFFFVLSGFIIFYAHRADIGKPDTLPRYAWRRVVRIYPLYWIALTLYLAGAVAGFGHPDFPMAPANIAWSYGLLVMTDQFTLPLRVAWTLFYEINFYMIFAVLLLSRRVGTLVLVGWSLLILFANLFDWHSKFYMLHMWNVYFLVGMAVNFGIARLKGWQGVVALLVGIAGVIALADNLATDLDATRSNPILLLALAVAFALVLLGAIVCERRYNLKPPKLLLLLGSASFSIYLFHSPVISVLAQINYILGPHRFPPALLFTAIAAISTSVGVAAHIIVERPMLSVLRKMEPRLRGRPHVELVEKTP